MNRRHLLAAAVLLVLCFLTYSNSLHNGFLIDDHAFILDNTQVRNIKFFAMSLTPQVTSSEIPRYYRPVHHALIMSNYLCFGKNPLGYHVVNLFFFYLCCIVLYGFLNLLFQNWKISFLTSLLFCAHPINGMLVNYVTATGCAAMVFSMLFSLTFYLLAEGKGKRIYGIMSFICFLIALLCHETAMVFPLYLAAVLFFAKGYSLKQTIKKIWPYCALALIYFIFRWEFASLKISIVDKIPIYDLSVFSYTASFFKLVLSYIFKLVFLKDIVLIWAIPIVKENLFWWNLGFFIILSGCCYLMFFVWKKNIRSLALAWFFIGFVPVTMGCLFQPHGGLQLEPHWLFFSSIGFFLFTANALCEAQRSFNKRWMPIAAVILLAIYIFNSRQYNYLWADEKRYCQYWIKVVPKNLNGKFFLANAYLYDKKFKEAKEIYDELLSKHWDSPKIYNNLGLIEYTEGNTRKAVEYFRTALQLKPAAAAYTNLGAALADLKDFKGAQVAYLKAIQLNQFSIEPRFNLAMMYREQKEFVKAADYLEQVLAIDPTDEPAIFFLGELNLVNGSKERAIELTKNLLTKSKDPQRLVSLGSRFAEQHFSNMAFALYSRALKIDPCYKEAYIEMGKVFGNHDQFNQAIVMWQEGLKCHPREKVFVDLISEARELLKEKAGK